MRLCDWRDLGPDPEPLGQRFERLAPCSPPPRRRQVLGRPVTCPLAHAFGEQAPCSAGDCPFFRVPGTRYACAVDEWSPRARHDQEPARWFRDLRDRVGTGS